MVLLSVKYRMLLALVIPLSLLVVVACSSPESNPSEPEPTATTVARSEATATTLPPEPTATTEPPTQTQPPAPASTETPTEPPAPTATLAPTTVPEPTATVAPPATPTAPEPPSASDVWNVRQFDISEPIMVLTFDAGADRGYAAEILDILAAEGIRASFGMTGLWAEDNPDLLQRMVDEGHHLINHSWSHPHFPELTTEERVTELHRLEELVRNQLGVELTPYFRPPFGEYDEATLTDLAANGYTVNVLWTVDTLGWNGLTADEINARVMATAAPGAIVLMHVGGQSQDAAALPEMIRLLRAQGYTFATAADLTSRG